MNSRPPVIKFASVDRFIESIQKGRGLPRRDPEPTSPSIVAFIIETALSQKHLPLEGIRRAVRNHFNITISRKTVARIIDSHDLYGGAQRDYLAWLEQEWLDGKRTLSPEEWDKLERFNPSVCERHAESKRPGALLCQTHFPLVKPEDRNPVHAHIAIDAYSGYAIGYLTPASSTRDAIELVHSHILPRYAKWSIPIVSILTTRDIIYGRTKNQPFPAYLLSHGISHQHQPSIRPNGFIERFSRIFSREFRLPLQVRMEAAKDNSILTATILSSLQNEFDAWLHTYNVKRPLTGYRNNGATPCSRQNPKEAARLPA